MPFNKVNTTLTLPQETAIQAAIDSLITNLVVKINLTKQERVQLSNIDNQRYAYVKRAIQNHATANPTLVSGFAGTLAEANNDLNLYDQLQKYITQILKVLEMYQDLQQVAGSEAYTWFREFYSSAQKAADNNVAGADAVVDDLKPLFEGQGGITETPPNP